MRGEEESQDCFCYLFCPFLLSGWASKGKEGQFWGCVDGRILPLTDLANKILPHVEPWKAEGTEGEKSQHGCTQPTRSSESQIWKLFPEQAGPRVVSLTFLSLV